MAPESTHGFRSARASRWHRSSLKTRGQKARERARSVRARGRAPDRGTWMGIKTCFATVSTNFDSESKPPRRSIFPASRRFPLASKASVCRRRLSSSLVLRLFFVTGTFEPATASPPRAKSASRPAVHARAMLSRARAIAAGAAASAAGPENALAPGLGTRHGAEAITFRGVSDRS